MTSLKNSIQGISVRYIVVLVLVFIVETGTFSSLYAQEKKFKKPSKKELKALAKARLAAEAADTVGMKADTIIVDTLTGDSIKFLKGSRPDTMLVNSGVLPFVKEYRVERISQRDSTGKLIKKEPMRPPSELAMQRSKLFKDTMSFNKTIALSFVAPGFGQVYNKQAWKLPILYGMVGGFAALGANASSKAKIYDDRFNQAVQEHQPQDRLDHLKYKANQYKTQKTLYIAGAIATYIYFVGDAALNYKGMVDKTKKSTMLSAIFPGAGQIYNGSYWKLPIVYGGFAVIGYVIDYNNRGYQRFKTAFNALTDGDPNTVDEFNGQYSADMLKNTRNSYRRYRDLGYVYAIGFYLLNVIDAHVDAYLRRYDISDNISMKIEPTVGERIYLASEGNINLVGMSMKITF